MKYLKFLSAIIIALAMVACSSKDDYSLEKSEIKVNADIHGLLTRAEQSSSLQDNSFVDDSSFKLYLTNASTTAPITGTPEAGYYTVTKKSGTYNFDTKAYYPADESPVNAFAIYPTRASKGDTSFAIIEDQSDAFYYQLSDLMYAYKANNVKSTNAIPLTFNHCLCKIVIKVVDSNGNACNDLEGYELSIESLYTMISLAFNDNKITTVDGSASSPATIQLGDYTGLNGMAAIVVPQTFDPGTTIKFRHNETIFTYNVTEAFEMVSGNVYTFKLKLDRTAITGSYSIKAWTNTDKSGTLSRE